MTYLTVLLAGLREWSTITAFRLKMGVGQKNIFENFGGGAGAKSLKVGGGESF